MAKRGRPKLTDRAKTLAKQKREQLKKDYSYGEGYPTVKEAKILIKEYYSKRGHMVKSVQNLRSNGFSVTFQETQAEDGKIKFDGPYGLDKVKISWFTMKRLMEEKIGRNKKI